MRLDLHNHTTAHSLCSVITPDELMIAAKREGLDGICLTEHDRLWTPEEAQALRKKHGLPVFRGMEVTTTGGDIIVFGLEEEPPSIWTPAFLRRKVDEAGGVAIAAHPFRGFLVFGFAELDMNVNEAVLNPTFAEVHGLEVCNGLVTDAENEYARLVADQMGLLMVGGSDSHSPDAVGTCVTVFEETLENERQLIAALLGKRYRLEKTR